MILQEIVSGLDSINREATIFAKSINGEFRASSPVALVELSDDELDLPTTQVAELKCPGYKYFMGVDLIKEFVEASLADNPRLKLEDRVAQLISYIKYDA